MAVRLNPYNAESVRQKIKVGQLIKSLQNHALGELEMSPTQIDAAKFLLNKRIPNPPQRTELFGSIEHRNIEVDFSDVATESQLPTETETIN